eukprot:5071841-Amphidinium_carterae.1
MSDNGGEFTAKPFIEGLHLLGVTLTTASSDRFWPYAVHFAAQLQQARALSYPWDQPMFGELGATWLLKA